MDNPTPDTPDALPQHGAESSPAAANPTRPSNAGEALQRYLKAQTTQIARIAASLNQHRQETQQLETALIARIGDVDDDRRQTAQRLQRSFQTHRDELDARLKHHSTLTAILLFVFSVLVVGTLVFFLFQLNTTQEVLETQMHDLRRTVEQIDPAHREEPDPQTRAQLDRLSAALAGISKSIERLNEQAKTAAPPLDLNLNLQPEPQSRLAATVIGFPTERETLDLTTAQRDPAPLASEALEPQPEAAATPEELAPPEPTAEAQLAPDVAGASASADITPDATAPIESTPADITSAAPDAESAATPDPDDPESSTEVSAATPATPPAAAPAVAELANQTVTAGDTPYSVQLIGFHKLAALEEFAANSKTLLPDVYYYRQESYQGRPWYVLIHSLHRSRDDAESVVAQLPPRLANLNLWIRRLKADAPLIAVRRQE